MTDLETLIRKIVREEIASAGAVDMQTPADLRGAMTQRDLAFRAGLNVDTVSSIEGGKVKRLRVGTLRKIADALGVDRNVYAAAAGRVRGTK